jgi:hypothetical protein
MYFWLHSIPERLAHGSSKVQFQLVAVMSLLALFTHNNAFWVAALLLALVGEALQPTETGVPQGSPSRPPTILPNGC